MQKEFQNSMTLREKTKNHAGQHISKLSKGKTPTTKVNNAVSSIFYKLAVTSGIMIHSLDIALPTTNFLHEWQITIVCGDQPL